MKKLYKFLCCVVLVFVFSINVVAASSKPLDLIALDTVVSIDTEKFTYQDVKFYSQADEKGNGIINFAGIKNKSKTKEYVSINILMFDKDKKNVGYVTYCSKSDYDSEFADYKIKAGDNAAFRINVSSKYFVEGKNLGDVSYFAVKDDNEHCEIGGFTQYDGMTIEEIIKKEQLEEKKPKKEILSEIFSNKIVLIVLGIFAVLLVVPLIYRIIIRIINLLKDKNDKAKQVTTTNNTFNNSSNNSRPLDLNYDTDDLLSSDDNISAGSNAMNGGVDANNQESTNKSDDDGESDLSKMFR